MTWLEKVSDQQWTGVVMFYSFRGGCDEAILDSQRATAVPGKLHDLFLRILGVTDEGDEPLLATEVLNNRHRFTCSLLHHNRFRQVTLSVIQDFYLVNNRRIFSNQEATRHNWNDRSFSTRR